jgi:hypothetical protein
MPQWRLQNGGSHCDGRAGDHLRPEPLITRSIELLLLAVLLVMAATWLIRRAAAAAACGRAAPPPSLSARWRSLERR